MSIRSEVERELDHRGVYGGSSLTIKEQLLACYQIIIFTIFILNITTAVPTAFLLFFHQKVFIKLDIIVRIIRLAIVMTFVNALIFWFCADNKWIQWSDLSHIFQYDSISWILGLHNWVQESLYLSILLWLLVIFTGLLQGVISYFAPNTAKYGYGLLNFPSLLTRMKPSRFFTLIQDGALAAFVIHIIMEKQYDLIGKGAMACLASIITVWILVATNDMDIFVDT